MSQVKSPLRQQYNPGDQQGVRTSLPALGRTWLICLTVGIGAPTDINNPIIKPGRLI